MSIRKTPTHKTAKSSHYDEAAQSYDALNELGSATVNKAITKLLKKHRAKSILDLCCGTGSQVFWLSERGFDVTGCDINSKMLYVAKQKAAEQGLSVPFFQGDMRTSKAGSFDAVITIFNAVGHLTRSDFAKAMRNVHANLKEGGIYIFDINNLSYLLKENNITKLTIDWLVRSNNGSIREIQYSTINSDGILASFTTTIRDDLEKQHITKSAQTLQVYRAKELRKMLRNAGFSHIRHFALDGSRFAGSKSDRILTIAQKKKAQAL